ncbi:hypothetical protein K3495_g13133, partial [Podosphaera aphanis]
MSDGSTPEAKGKGNDSPKKRFPFRCYNCNEKGHTAKRCPKKRQNQSHNSQVVTQDRKSVDIGPPAAIADEYCQIPEDEFAATNYTAQVDPRIYENMVAFYENEMARRRGKASSERDLPVSEAPGASIQFTQQILSASGENSVANRWLFDTGADDDATNRRQNFKPGTVVELKPKQFPIQTVGGIVCAECVGEVWLSLTGPGGAQTSMRLKYVVYLKIFPLNIVSGERFYRSGGYLERNRIISPNGEVLSYINAERRGFFLWLYNQPEPLKFTNCKKAVNVTSMSNEEVSLTEDIEEQSFQQAYQACWGSGVFKMSDDVMKRLILWHRRLCHPSAERLKWTIKNTVGIDLHPSQVESLPCEACDMGKSLKYTTVDRKPRMKNVGEGWHYDVETLNPVTLEGYGYFCLTTEDVSRYRIFRALKKKSDAADELRSILSKANFELRQRYGIRVKRLTIDGGRDWGLKTLQDFATKEEIDVIISAPNNQYQNGVSERGIRFVQDSARCCSIQMKFPSVFWNYMLEMVCYTLNCTSQSSVEDKKTPWEVYWSQMDPDRARTEVDHLWIPGTLCVTHVDATHRITSEKLDAKGTRSIFFGYRGRKNKLVWLLDGGRFLVSPQVTAYESVNPGLGCAADPREIVRSLPNHVQNRLKARKQDYARNEDYNVPQDDEPQSLLPRGRGRPKRSIQRPYESQQMIIFNAPLTVDNEMAILLRETDDQRSSESENEVPQMQKTHLFNMTRKAIDQQLFGLQSDGDEVFRIIATCPGASSYLIGSSTNEPTFSEAMKGNEKKEWMAAMNQEIEGCLSRGTFKFVARALAKDRGRLVTSKWVLKKKYKSNMELDKFKARVVAKGFTQTKGIEFNETTSTTARSASWRCLMALAALKSWHILQADFISAYLAGDLKETIFMEQFPYLKEYFETHPKAAKDLGYTETSVIELKRPLYGLKQSGACWQDKVRCIMMKRGYKPLVSDNAIYMNKEKGITVASYVDDFLFIGPNVDELKSLSESLNSEVPLNDLGDAHWFLGVRVRRSSPTGCVRLDQEQYIERSFQELEISRKFVETPMSPGSRVDMRRNTDRATSKELYNFQKLVGKYNFSSCMIRCDTAQATSQMARFMCNPTPQHLQHMMRVPHYLSGCADRGLFYDKNHRHLNEFGELGLFCAVDSSFADDHDTAKSTTGYVIFMAGGPVIWRSKLQSTVSTLTCEAEYVAMFEAAKDCAWIRSFLTELGEMSAGPIPILEDNTGAIKWAANNGMSSGRRHIRVQYHYIKQEVRDGNVYVRQIKSEDNPGTLAPVPRPKGKRKLTQAQVDELEAFVRLSRKNRQLS